VRRSNLRNTASTSFSPNSFFTSFTASHSDKCYIGKDALTWSVLIYLFRREGKGGKQLHHYFHDYLHHGPCRRDSGIDIKAVHEVFDRFEQVNESIITGADVLDCLICLRVTTMFMSGINKDYTERSLAKPANIAFAGGKGWRVNHQRCTSIDPFRRTKPITSPRAVLAQRVYSTETTIERFHDFAIAASEFGECSCLLLKHCGNRLD